VTSNHCSSFTARQHPPQLLIKLTEVKSLQENNLRTPPIFNLGLKIGFRTWLRYWEVVCKNTCAQSKGKGFTWRRLPHLAPLFPLFFLSFPFCLSSSCFHMLSQFPFVIAFFLLSRVFSLQHQELKHTAVHFIFQTMTAA